MVTIRLPNTDVEDRQALHDEVHARPTPKVAVPARVVHVAMDNTGISIAAEATFLASLAPGVPDLEGRQFWRSDHTDLQITWERHSEFSRYTLILAPDQPVPSLEAVPGKVISAHELLVKAVDVHAEEQAAAWVESQRQQYFGSAAVVYASRIGRGHSWVVTDFRIGPHGLERMVIGCAHDTPALRVGRSVQRLVELETYRLMALRGLGTAKRLSGQLGAIDGELADLTNALAQTQEDDASLLARLTRLAAQLEQLRATSRFRFGASAAYAAIVQQRLDELRELPVPGIQRLGEFMQRRFAPAMMTVQAVHRRLAEASEHTERAGALLRTRVDIQAEAQNQQLLQRLAEGQATQLRLQFTVEGLSLAAITYYVLGLLGYATKGLALVGVPVMPDLVVAAASPLVLGVVWYLTRRIHHRLMH